MRLPPWVWRVVRSRRTRLAGKIGLGLGIVVAGGFYPVANWWGAREREKAEAEVRARGFPVRERTVEVEEVRESFFCQPEYLAEAERPMKESLGAELEFARSPHNTTLALLGRVELSPDQIAADRKWLAPLGARRAALIQATRQSTPLASQAEDARIEVPEKDFLLALRLARFLRDDAALAKATGDSTTAFESMEAYFRIMTGDLLPPRVIQWRKSILPFEVSEMVSTVVLGAGCRGYDEDQLAKLNGMLGGADFQTACIDYFREMPGDCIDLHRQIVNGKSPQPRPYAGDLFAAWSWDQAEIRRRAEVQWEARKPFGLLEAEMARSLRKVADLAEEPSLASLEELLRKPTKGPRFAARLFEQGRVAQFLLNWSPECQTPLVLARHLVALERHRLRHGGLPSRLEDLDADLRGGLPMDPFTGTPLDYALDGRLGFKLGFSSPENPRTRKTRSFLVGR